MAPPFSDTRWDTFGLLKEAYLALDQRFAEVTERIVPVDRSVVDLLVRLARSPQQRARPTDLARGLSMVPSHITRCLEEAERRGLIERRAHPSDGRSTLIVLALAGEELCSQLEGPLADARDRFIHGLLGERDVAELERLTRTLRNHAQGEAGRSPDGT